MSNSSDNLENKMHGIESIILYCMPRVSLCKLKIYHIIYSFPGGVVEPTADVYICL